MLHFSKSFLIKKQTHLHLGWPEGEYNFIFVWTPLSCIFFVKYSFFFFWFRVEVWSGYLFVWFTHKRHCKVYMHWYTVALLHVHLKPAFFSGCLFSMQTLRIDINSGCIGFLVNFLHNLILFSVLLRCSLMKDYFFRPPINKLSHTFIDKSLELAYRTSYQDEVWCSFHLYVTFIVITLSQCL